MEKSFQTEANGTISLLGGNRRYERELTLDIV
jgi:hypothetical protein